MSVPPRPGTRCRLGRTSGHLRDGQPWPRFSEQRTRRIPAFSGSSARSRDFCWSAVLSNAWRVRSPGSPATQAHLVWEQPRWYILGVARSSVASDSTVARTIRFPAGLRQKLSTDAERCGRSFEGQVIAVLRRHYGEDVDISPSPAEILALATASMAGMSPTDARLIERRLKASDR